MKRGPSVTMLRGLFALLMLCLTAGPARADDLQADLLHVQSLLNKGDCGKLSSIADRWLGPAREDSTPELAKSVLGAAKSLCLLGHGKSAEALPAAKAAAQTTSASPVAYFALFLAASDQNDTVSSVVGLEGVARGDRQLLNRIPFRDVLRFIRSVNDQGERRRVLRALFVAEYAQDDDPFLDLSAFWVELAADDVEDKHFAEAREVLGRVTHLKTHAEVLVENRFAVLFEDRPADVTLRAVAETGLQRLRTLSAEHPDLLTGPIQIAETLSALGRFDEALAVLDTAARGHDLPAKADFKDYDQFINWWGDTRSEILWLMGRFDDSASQMKKARLPEGGFSNISQTLNLAETLNEMGRPKEALETLRVFDAQRAGVSQYGQAMIALEKVCAGAQLDDQAMVKAGLEALKGLEKHAPAALTDGLVCANDMDGAAASLIRRLETPGWRDHALVGLSRFLHSPTPPRGLEIERRIDQLRARPDVQAAAAKAGHVRTFDVYRWDE